MAKFEYEKTVNELAEKIIEDLKPVIGFLTEITREFFNYPDKNVIRLALFSKKSRIRKKNRTKILNWIVEVKKE